MPASTAGGSQAASAAQVADTSRPHRTAAVVEEIMRIRKESAAAQEVADVPRPRPTDDAHAKRASGDETSPVARMF